MGLASGVLFDLPGFTRQDYEALLGELDLERNPPAGGILHLAAPNPTGGWLILDLWESEEAFERFARERLLPAVKRLGLPLVRPRPFVVHNLFAADIDWLREFGHSAFPESAASAPA
jgi:hypothetical protein